MRSLLNWLSQISMVTRFSLKGIPERKGAAAAAAFGIAGVVAVLVAVLSIGAGFRHAITAAGSPSRAIILRSGSTSEMMSSLSQEDSTVIADGPGIVHDGGAPEVSSELYLVINLPKRSTGTDANVPLRGVGEMAYKIRDEVKIVEGRRFTPGRNEVIVGQSAAREFSGLNVGGKIKVGGSYWDVVGVFTANGGVCESEIWGDAGVLQSAFNRGSSFQMMCVKLTSPSAFASFTNSVMSDPRIKISARQETEYYAAQSKTLSQIIEVLGTLIAVLMAIGAIFGALNTMYSAVAARTREIATLRALGFGSGPVVISVMLESLALALVGGVVGGAFAYFVFDGYRTATMNWQSFSQVAFAFSVTPALLVEGAIFAAVIGFFGGLFPAIRAARLPIAAGLREM